MGQGINWCGHVLEFSRETKQIGCVYVEKEIYFKKLAHAIMEVDKVKIYRVGCQTGEPGVADNAVQIQRLSAGSFLLLGGGQPFVLSRPSTDWMRPNFTQTS